jgi:hypothetical protein
MHTSVSYSEQAILLPQAVLKRWQRHNLGMLHNAQPQRSCHANVSNMLLPFQLYT